MHLTITWPVEWLKVTRVQYGQTSALLGCEPGWIGVKGIGYLMLGLDTTADAIWGFRLARKGTGCPEV